VFEIEIFFLKKKSTARNVFSIFRICQATGAFVLEKIFFSTKEVVFFKIGVDDDE